MKDEDLRKMIWAKIQKLDGKSLRIVYQFILGLSK